MALDTSEADFDRVIAINLKSAFFGTQAAAKQFITQGGGGLIQDGGGFTFSLSMPRFQSRALPFSLAGLVLLSGGIAALSGGPFRVSAQTSTAGASALSRHRQVVR